MGEAKRRGTREQRVALAVERRQHDDAVHKQRELRDIRAKPERVRSRYVLAALAALAAMPVKKKP